MARLYPFRALRYDPARVNMQDVVTQPYDKISPEMQERYYELSPYNLIRVILGKKFPTDTEGGENVYTRAAETLNDWRAKAILKQEPEPALYGYSQTYTVPGTEETRERRGFIALGHLYDYADRVVFRHEQTFPKHKSDRLALFKATRAYCEQIYMLYSDPGFTAEKAIFESGSNPELEITDEYGVLHRVWKLTDPALIQRVLDAMSDKQLIIADGHHRYETSVAYMHERAQQLGINQEATASLSSFRKAGGSASSALSESFGYVSSRPNDAELQTPAAPATTTATLPSPAFPEAAMMMTFVNMDAPGITILPTHRVVSGLTGFNPHAFAEQARQYFTVKELPTSSEGRQLLKRLDEISGVAFIAATRDGDFLLKPRHEAVASLLTGLSPRQQQLDVTQLHKVVLEKLLGLDEDTVRAGNNVRYLREASEAIDLVSSGDADVAFLIKPVTLDQMKDISLNLEVMPQKSTDFYPKLLSGLAMYALDPASDPDNTEVADPSPS